jgi:hypothetical protein
LSSPRARASGSRSYLPSLWRDAGGSPWLPRARARVSAPSLGLLSIGAVNRIVGTRLEVPPRPPPRRTSPAVWRRAPFYAPDVARALLDRGVPPAPSMRFPYGCKTTQSVLELDAQAAPVRNKQDAERDSQRACSPAAATPGIETWRHVEGKSCLPCVDDTRHSRVTRWRTPPATRCARRARIPGRVRFVIAR